MTSKHNKKDDKVMRHSHMCNTRVTACVCDIVFFYDYRHLLEAALPVRCLVRPKQAAAYTAYPLTMLVYSYL